MATRMTSPLAGFGWLRNAVNVGARKPGTLMLAALLLFLVSMIPSLITMPIQVTMPGDMRAFYAALAIAMVAGLALSPVFAGFLQVIDAIERGRPVRARDVFGAYRTGVAKRSILFSLAMMVVYLAVVALGMLIAVGEFRDAYLNLLTTGVPASMEGMDTETLRTAMLRMFGLVFLLMLPVAGMWAIGFGQIAIGGRGVGQSLADGVSGALKNFVPMLILAVMILVGGFVLMLLIGLVLVVLSAIANYIHEYVAFAVIVPIYFAIVMAFYVVIFALAYYFWRDVCAPNADPEVAHAEV